MKRKLSKRIRGKRDKESAPIGFHEWTLDARRQFDELLEDMVERLHDRNSELLERFTELLDNMLKEGFRIATERYECSAMFEGTDPLMLSIQLPLGAADYEGPAWNFNITELIENECDVVMVDGSVEDESREFLDDLRNSLNKMVGIVDKALAG